MFMRTPLSVTGRAPARHRAPPQPCLTTELARPTTCIRCTAAKVTVLDVLETCGLKPYQMDRVLRELERSESTSSPAWLSERLSLVKAALGSDAPLLSEALYNGGVEMLQQDLTLFPEQLVKLKNALSGAEAGTIVSKEPRLLWLADVDTKVAKVLGKLLQIWPYKGTQKKKQEEIIKVVQEYPELLVRLGYFVDDPKIKTVQDLPVDLQNRILRSYC